MWPLPRFKIEKLRGGGSTRGMWNVYDRRTGKNYQLYFWSNAILLTNNILKINP